MARFKLTPEKERTILANIDWARIDAMTDEEISRAIARDPESRLTPLEQVRIMWAVNSPKVPVKRKLRLLRRALRMTRAQFGETYGIPEKTLQGWEQGAREPDQAALSYLAVIAEMPDRVRKVLRRSA